MQRSLLFFVGWLFVLVQASAQVITTQPAFPTADQEVTLIVDLRQAKDGRAAGLLGKTNDVYLWSGAGSTETNPWEFAPTGQTDFSKPYEPGRMTALGNDRWQIKLTPRTYFNVPAAKTVKRLGVVIKSGDGRFQTEDLFVSVYENKLSVIFTKPAEQRFFVEANSVIDIQAIASQKANFTITRQGTTIFTASNRDTVSFSFSAGNLANTVFPVIVQAKTATETAADTFFYSIRPQPKIADLPAGVKDGINYLAADRVILSFFAPEKQFVHVIGEFNNWTYSPAYLMNRTPDGNRYWIELGSLPAGQEVAYQYLVNGTLAVADPYADKILDPNNDKYISSTTYPNLKAYPQGAQGIVSVLQTNQTPYVWKTASFQRPDPKKMVVYELLVRDFSSNRSYKTLTDSLSYLKRLGVNVIELMPVMEFSGNDSWGYNPIFYFAPDKAYGTKDDLKRFVDACHSNGIAVVLDMVLNQADYEFPYVKMYWNNDRPAANNPFFNQQATHPFSVFFDFNHESTATQSLVQRVCQYWIQEFKFDGYRFDLSKGFTQKNTGNDVNAWGTYDASRVAIWKRIYDQIRSYDKTAYVILEHFADNQEEKELANYGMMLWGNHNYDFRGAARGQGGNFEGISYQKRGFTNPNLIGYAESHDEERIMFDLEQNGIIDGSYNIKTVATALERSKLAAAFLLSVPGPKLIWQFGELGYDLSINACSDGTTISNDCRTSAKPVRWNYAQDAQRLKLYKTYSEFIKLKQSLPAFSSTDFTMDFSTTIKRLTLPHVSGSAFLIGNFETRSQTVKAGFPSGGIWYHYFTGQEINVQDPNMTLVLEPGAFHLFTQTKLPAPESGIVPFTLTASLITAVPEELQLDLQLAPNPTTDEIILNLTNGYRGPVTITLIDMQGREVVAKQAQKNSPQLRQPISTRSLPAATYLIRVTQGDQQAVKRFVKE